MASDFRGQIHQSVNLEECLALLRESLVFLFLAKVVCTEHELTRNLPLKPSHPQQLSHHIGCQHVKTSRVVTRLAGVSDTVLTTFKRERRDSVNLVTCVHV